MSRRNVADTSVMSLQDLADTLSDRRRAVYELIRRNPGRTDRELSREAGYADPNQLRPRRTELLDMGLIREAGKRRCEVTGKTATTWRITTRRDQLELFSAEEAPREVPWVY